MRSFHESEGLAPPTQKLLLPENIVLLATHGSREVPSHFVLSEAFSDPHYGDPRLKDFSDYATGLIQEYFDGRSIITPPRYGRIGGDANRTPAINRDFGSNEQKAAFRSTNMSGLFPIWKAGHEPNEYEQMLLLDENHSPYFDKIVSKALSQLEQAKEPLLFIDLHDTGDVRLLHDGSAVALTKRIEKYQRTRFWEAIISDKDGKTARPAITEAFRRVLTQAYDQVGVPNSPNDVLVNEYYKGGHVTGFIGEILPKKLIKLGVDPKDVTRINAIQLEIPRHRFMDDEANQVISPEKIALEAALQYTILQKTGEIIGSILE